RVKRRAGRGQERRGEWATETPSGATRGEGEWPALRSWRFSGRSFVLLHAPPPRVSGSPLRPLINDQRDRNRHLDSLSVIRLCGYRSVVPPRLKTSIGIDENANQIIAPLNNRLVLQSQKPQSCGDRLETHCTCVLSDSEPRDLPAAALQALQRDSFDLQLARSCDDVVSDHIDIEPDIEGLGGSRNKLDRYHL